MKYRRIIEFQGRPPYDSLFALPCVECVRVVFGRGGWTAEMSVKTYDGTVKAYPGDLLCEDGLGHWHVSTLARLKWEMLADAGNGNGNK